jgi:[CysO sulfur-carrier protein]-S-L-cysteine hydrolase
VDINMPPFTRLAIPDLLLAEVIEHARTDAPIECCGLLAGRSENSIGTVTTRFPIDNAMRSPTEYETDARGMIAAFRHMREHKLELLAIYHSHPSSEPVPSKRDVERNTYGETAVHLIVGLAGSEHVVRAWWVTETGYREAEWDPVSL